MRTLLILFKNLRLEKEQTEAFRKNINFRTDNRYDLLHNHAPDGSVIYRYPLVQFRSFKGFAALFGINEGYDLVWNLLGKGELGEPFTTNFEVVQKSETDAGVGKTFHTYSVKDIIPFNAENYRTYRSLNSLTERTQFMEDKMANHLVRFCREMAVGFEKGSIEVRLKAINKQPEPEMKMERMLSFDVLLETNLNLPDFIALGRFKSLGMGTVKKLR